MTTADGETTISEVLLEFLSVIKMLALSFLLLVDVTLIAEGFDTHVPKGYIYFAMASSMAVETLNIRIRARRKAPEPVHLRKELP